eukprot:7489980-Pyramimonas_sp.AAC.1
MVQAALQYESGGTFAVRSRQGRRGLTRICAGPLCAGPPPRSPRKRRRPRNLQTLGTARSRQT